MMAGVYCHPVEVEREKRCIRESVNELEKMREGFYFLKISPNQNDVVFSLNEVTKF